MRQRAAAGQRLKEARSRGIGNSQTLANSIGQEELVSTYVLDGLESARRRKSWIGASVKYTDTSIRLPNGPMMRFALQPSRANPVPFIEQDGDVSLFS
jgi:hypothetical protein